MGSLAYFSASFLNTVLLNFQRISCCNDFPVKNLSFDYFKLSTIRLNRGYLGLFWTTLCKNNLSISITVPKQGPNGLENAPMGLNFSFDSKCYFCVLTLPIIFHAHLKQSKLALKLQRVLEQMTQDKNFGFFLMTTNPCFITFEIKNHWMPLPVCVLWLHFGCMQDKKKLVVPGAV